MASITSPGVDADVFDTARRAPLRLIIANRNYSAWSMVAWLAARACERDGGAPLHTTVVPMRTPEWQASLEKLLRGGAGSGRLPALFVQLGGVPAATGAAGGGDVEEGGAGESESDVLVTDSLAICETLAELYPHVGLWPSLPAARARARSLCCEAHASFMAVRDRMCFNEARAASWGGRSARALDAAGRAATRANLLRVVELWRDTLGAFGDRCAKGSPEDTAKAEVAGERGFLFGRWCLADVFFAHMATRMEAYAVDVSELYDSLPPAAGAAATRDDVLAYMRRLRSDLPGVSEWRAAALEEPWRIPDFEVVSDGSGVEGDGLRPVAD